MVALHAEPTWVVVGSGSAGRRHAAALRRRDPQASITVVRRSASRQPLGPLVSLGAHLVPTVQEAAALAPSIAVVAGPASTHGAAVQAMVAAGATVLVEKPLAATRIDGEAIRTASNQGQRPVCVGYHLRGDEIVAAFREGLDRLGTIDAFSLDVGQHLDQWRPDVDPSQSVTARHDLGGGVLLELSHEIDAAIWCFGPITEVTARLRHDGAPTDGRVETVADLAVTTQLGARGTIHLDMVREMPRRVWQASGPTGTIEADLLSGRVRGTGAAAEVDRQVPAGWRDRAEDRLVANLFAVDQGRAEPACSVDDGLAVLRVIDAARTSAQEGSGPVPVPVGPDRAPRSSAAPDGALR